MVNFLLTLWHYFQSCLASGQWFFCMSLYLPKVCFRTTIFSTSVFHLQQNNQDAFQLLWKSSLNYFKCLTKTWLFQDKFFSFSVLSPIFQHPIRTIIFIHIIVKCIVFIQNRAGKILGKVIQFIHYSRAGSAVHILDRGLSSLFLKTSTTGESITSLGNLFQRLTICTTRK